MGRAAVYPALVPVAEADRVRLAFMLQEYLQELGAGSEYPYLDLYWRERDRHAYWIAVSDQVVGFALVRRVGAGIHEVAEFFVRKPWRRHGVGQAAAMTLFAAHPGCWQVRSYPSSAASHAFWTTAVPTSAHRVRDEQSSVFSFTVGAAL